MANIALAGIELAFELYEHADSIKAFVDDVVERIKTFEGRFLEHYPIGDSLLVLQSRRFVSLPKLLNTIDTIRKFDPATTEGAAVIRIMIFQLFKYDPSLIFHRFPQDQLYFELTADFVQKAMPHICTALSNLDSDAFYKVLFTLREQLSTSHDVSNLVAHHIYSRHTFEDHFGLIWQNHSRSLRAAP